MTTGEKIAKAERNLVALRQVLRDLTEPEIPSALEKLDLVLPLAQETLVRFTDPADGRTKEVVLCVARLQQLRGQLAEQWRQLLTLLNSVLIPRALLVLASAQMELAVGELTPEEDWLGEAVAYG